MTIFFFFSLLLLLLFAFYFKKSTVSNFSVFLAFFDRINEDLTDLFVRDYFFTLFPKGTELNYFHAHLNQYTSLFFKYITFGISKGFRGTRVFFETGGFLRLFIIFFILAFLSCTLFYFLRQHKTGFYYRWFYLKEVIDADDSSEEPDFIEFDFLPTGKIMIQRE